MGLEKLLGLSNFYSIHRRDNIIWVYYWILYPFDEFELTLSLVSGATIKTFVKKDERLQDVYISYVNLVAPYREDGKYHVRWLVETIVHELLHTMGVKDEDLVERLTKELLKGYRFSKIRP